MTKPAVEVRFLMVMLFALVAEVPVLLIMRSQGWCRFCR